MSFLDQLSENSERYPDKPALEFVGQPGRDIRYARLGDLVGRSATYLRSLGVGPGDRVALQLDKGLEFILLNLGTLHVGAVSLPLNPAYPPEELGYFLRDSEARVFFGPAPACEAIARAAGDLTSLRQTVTIEAGAGMDFLASLEGGTGPGKPSVRASADDTAVLVYTSGTTGRPKGAEITHANVTAMVKALHAAWEWEADDVLLHVLPLFHIHGLFVALYGALYAGATTVLMDAFDAQRTLASLTDKRSTVFMGVPTIHRRLLGAAGGRRIDLSHMRLITSGSDRLPDALFEAYQETFSYTLVERYGLTETGINCSNPVRGDRRMGSVGTALPDVALRVVGSENGQAAADGEVGEVQVRGPNVFKRYWREPEQTRLAFTEDGWFRTGDLGLLEPDHYLTLRGRSKDLIISGGLNVYPPEVERVLHEHPAVEAAAVIGCPDEEWGERVVAIVTHAGGSAPSAEDLISFCRQRLAPYKTPRVILFRTDMPRNAMGKIQKAILRSEICGKAS